MDTYLSQGSNLAEAVDNAFIFIFVISFVFTFAITAFMIYILIRYSRKKVKNPQQFSGSTKLEILWTVIPLIIVLGMFYYGWVGFTPMRNVPADAMKIKVIGRMWTWEFDYGNGKVSKDLVVPLNRNIKLDLYSEDVNHGLFIPAFRVKEDVVPGYDNFLWFRPILKGTFDVYCSEYCGLDHSGMYAKAIVMDSLDYEKWLAELPVTGIVPDLPGLAVLKNNGCIACHSLDGSKVVGPTFKGLYGSKRTILTDQGETVIDAYDDYIKVSILEPNSELVKGYNKGLMQSYKDILSGDDIDKIIEYLKTLEAP